jgi:hypothetical protein
MIGVDVRVQDTDELDRPFPEKRLVDFEVA